MDERLSILSAVTALGEERLRLLDALQALQGELEGERRLRKALEAQLQVSAEAPDGVPTNPRP